MSLELNEYNNLLKVGYESDGRHAYLLSDLTVAFKDSDNFGGGGIITVPAGFRTDFASVPKIFWNILPPTGEYSVPAIVHDYLYATHIIPKEEADLIFYILMKRYKVSNWKCAIMYRAVKWFGKKAWKGTKE